MISSTPIHNLRNRFASFALKSPKKYTRELFGSPRKKRKRKCLCVTRQINKHSILLPFLLYLWEMRASVWYRSVKFFFFHCCQRDNCVNCEWVSHGTHSLFFCHIWHVGVSNSGYLPIWQSNCLCHLLF